MALITAAEQVALTQAADDMSEIWQQICAAKRLRQPVPRSAIAKLAGIVAVALRITTARAHDEALLAALEAWIQEDLQ
ncbi:hypothetical protein [Kaistia terrae]|uniref:Uncharacterized protein n=1 Tax=Kaistia terrae TaxID=537017 RepID=A0ABW0Q3D6_9HYPH|nr:hypothetical protein [Kaistia terrae]MCX5581353.1 hypothetical protein [Kaistia terrae]